MTSFLENIFPDSYIPSVFELPLEALKERGIRGLVFDIDNTVAPYDVAEPDEALIDLFTSLKNHGFHLCIFSNNNERRVKRFAKPLGVLAVHRAGKPGIKKLQIAMKKMGTDQSSTAIVGDQIFTDIWCGHKAGLYCIMTAPICDRDQLVTKVKRGLERQFMRIYFKRNANS